ncbi:hypothetical protein ACFVZW_05800 [Streptomyces sp. NPDC059567]|uniref:hypothetical protein n=1 Tax=Streptomyces sp. NPDC059567 TaxID=3346867 RepID=UPI0036968559
MLRRAAHIRRTVGTAAAALILTGCGATAPGPTVPPTPQAQDELLRTVERTLVDRCLAARGLTLAAKPRTPEADRSL